MFGLQQVLRMTPRRASSQLPSWLSVGWYDGNERLPVLVSERRSSINVHKMDGG